MSGVKQIIKYIVYTFSGIVLLGILGMMFFYATVDIFGEPSFEEIKRATSPDSVVDAILVRSNAGATTDFGYHVYIVPKDSTYKKKNALFNADHTFGIEINWREARKLDITYKEARMFHFSNFWNSSEVYNYNYNVEINLIPTAN